MKNIIFTAFIFLLTFTPAISQADYYAQDYDPSYVPYNFQEGADSDFDGCSEVLKQYDTGYWQLDEKFEALKKGTDYNGPVWVPMGSESAFNLNQLRDFAEDEIRSCLIDYREYLKEKEDEAAEQAKLEAEEEAKEQRLSDIENALINCDFAFFDKMTSSEKMDTFDERDACKSTNETGSNIANEIITDQMPSPAIAFPKPTPVVIETPKSVAAPKPLNTNTQDVAAELEQSVNTSEDSITSTTTEDEIIAISQEDSNEMTEEKATENVEQTQENKPSVFKRIVNFLFGWML